MPIPDLGSPLVADTDAKAAEVNAKFDVLKSVLDPVNGTGIDGDNFPVDTPGGIWLCDGAGRPRFVTLTGDLSVDDDGKVTLNFAGTTNIPGEESRTNTAYGTLATPDQVAGVVLPANGLIVVLYSALFTSSVGGAGSAAIFLGSNQLKYRPNNNDNPQVQDSGPTAGTANRYRVLGTYAPGLTVGQQQSATIADDVTTGQSLSVDQASGVSLGGACYIFAAAGTYTVSIRFKATSGSVSAKQRKLWVGVRG